MGSLDDPMHTHAVETYNRCEDKIKKKREQEAKKRLETQTVLVRMGNSMIQLFHDFVKDRLYEETDGIHFTEYDVRVRTPRGPWPEGTLRLTGQGANFLLEQLDMMDEGVCDEWDTVASGSSVVVIKALVERIHAWRTRQIETKEQHGK